MSRLLAPLSALVLLAGGCNSSPSPEPKALRAPSSSTTAAAARKAKVQRIVFVGKQGACDCTRKTIDGTWAALQGALGAAGQVPVEKIQVDVDREKVEIYRGKRPFMALPAVYCLEAGDGLVELLQGEVTEAQFKAVLQ